MKPYSLPNFICPGCHAQINMGANVLGSSTEIKKGKIIVCGHCAIINKIGDSGLVRVAEEELSTYPIPFQKAIEKAQDGVREKMMKNLGQ